MRISCPSYRLRDTAKARATFDTLSLGVADGLFAPRARCLYEFPGEIAGFEIFCGTSDSNRWKAHDIRIFEIRLPPARRLTSSIPFLPHILIKATTCPTSTTFALSREEMAEKEGTTGWEMFLAQKGMSLSLYWIYGYALSTLMIYYCVLSPMTKLSCDMMCWGKC